jgi:hypothetical protein
MKWGKGLKVVGVVVFAALGVYEYTQRIGNDELVQSIRAAMGVTGVDSVAPEVTAQVKPMAKTPIKPITATPVKPITATPVKPVAATAIPTPVKPSLAFKVAPDASDMFDAAKLIANAINPELEKKWLGIRLHTRLSREYEAQSAANLNVKKNTLKTLELTSKIDAIKNGEAVTNTPETTRVDAAGKAALYNELAQLSVSLLSYTAAKNGAEAFVSLRLGDTTYDRVQQHHYVGGFEVASLLDHKRCVVLRYKSSLVQNRCL